MKGFRNGFLAGALTGLVLGAGGAYAARSSQSDILYNIASQNFYLTQKMIATAQAQHQILLQIADRTKVKPETLNPINNRLQQELFNLDLKLKELNR